MIFITILLGLMLLLGVGILIPKVHKFSIYIITLITSAIFGLIAVSLLGVFGILDLIVGVTRSLRAIWLRYRTMISLWY